MASTWRLPALFRHPQSKKVWGEASSHNTGSETLVSIAIHTSRDCRTMHSYTIPLSPASSTLHKIMWAMWMPAFLFIVSCWKESCLVAAVPITLDAVSSSYDVDTQLCFPSICFECLWSSVSENCNSVEQHSASNTTDYNHVSSDPISLEILLLCWVSCNMHIFRRTPTLVDMNKMRVVSLGF